jgi:glutathione S-transferase
VRWPRWRRGVRDISPYVTKVVNYMTMAGIPFEWKAQDLATLGTDSPTAKLPYIIDEGVQVNDSTRIIQYLQERFEIYVPYIVGGPQLSELPQEVQDALLAFREKIHDEHLKQGMGLRPHEDIVKCLQEDLDALSTFLGDKPFFMGEEPTSFDATIYSTFRHIADMPWDWAGRDYARSKSNLVAYADRMRARFNV